MLKVLGKVILSLLILAVSLVPTWHSLYFYGCSGLWRTLTGPIGWVLWMFSGGAQLAILIIVTAVIYLFLWKKR
jgi:hypothetical protein